MNCPFGERSLFVSMLNCLLPLAALLTDESCLGWSSISGFAISLQMDEVLQMSYSIRMTFL